MQDNIIILENNPRLTGQAEVFSNIAYSQAGGAQTALTLICPWADRNAPLPSYPLVVFVQGSAWTFPNVGFELPQLCALARRGYVVATLTHRNCLDGHPFPAYLQDVKCAIRFQRANSAQYLIDKTRVGIWGTSSGGNTALLVGLTGDDPTLKTEEYAAESDAVKLVVDCFGPTDLPSLMQAYITSSTAGVQAAVNDDLTAIARGLIGGNDPEQVFRGMSPILRAQPGADYPPFLLLHGDADEAVPYAQSLAMYEKLIACGARAQLVRVKDAPHEGSFWSEALYNIIFNFIEENI